MLLSIFILLLTLPKIDIVYPITNDITSHVSNIGRIVEKAENSLRGTAKTICFEKLQTFMNELRCCPESLAPSVSEEIKNELSIKFLHGSHSSVWKANRCTTLSLSIHKFLSFLEEQHLATREWCVFFFPFTEVPSYPLSPPTKPFLMVQKDTFNYWDCNTIYYNMY